jgi:DNA-binding NarL/FixJ family response regulator
MASELMMEASKAMKTKTTKTSIDKSRVLVVDDHPIVRELLAEMINHQPDLMVCGEAEDRHEALTLLEHDRPELVIVDLVLKNTHGLDLIKDIHARWPAVAVLVVSMHEEPLYAERALHAGARGYITKQEATTNILVAIRRVLRGEVYLSEKMALPLAAKAVGHAARAPAFSIERLSDRELQVFELIGKGHGSVQISDELKLDIKTVETYRERIKKKLNLRDAAELLQTAITWVRSTSQ